MPTCCHTFAECLLTDAQYECQVPPFRRGCGACSDIIPRDQCTSDTQCDPGLVCDPAPCLCRSVHAFTCQPGCKSDADCAEPDLCGADHRCRHRPCNPDCNGNYACSGEVCFRKQCTADADCATGGSCVNGQCSRSIGQCVLVAQ